jgi:hypothetical protein
MLFSPSYAVSHCCFLGFTRLPRLGQFRVDDPDRQAVKIGWVILALVTEETTERR